MNHFSIQGNQLVNVSSVNDGYYNIQCFTPQKARDVTVSVDVTYPADDDFDADPQIVVRATDASVTDYDTLDGYTFYAFRDYVAIGREEAGDFDDDLASVDLDDIASDLQTGTPYHFTFSVRGTNPPVLDGTVSDKAGKVIAKLHAEDTDTTLRYASSGRVSVGVGTDGQNVRFDNFVQTTTVE